MRSSFPLNFLSPFHQPNPCSSLTNEDMSCVLWVSLSAVDCSMSSLPLLWLTKLSNYPSITLPPYIDLWVYSGLCLHPAFPASNSVWSTNKGTHLLINCFQSPHAFISRMCEIAALAIHLLPWPSVNLKTISCS